MENNGSPGQTSAPVHGSSVRNPGSPETQGAAIFAAIQGTLTPTPRDNPHPYAGIRAGEIIAWRGWLVKFGKLRSMYVEREWEEGKMSVNPDRCGDVPEYLKDIADITFDNNVGVHAFKEFSDAKYYIKNCYLFSYDDIIVLGKVALWGDVVEHQKGYRAEYARVVSFEKIFGPYFWKKNKILRRLRDLHRCT